MFPLPKFFWGNHVKRCFLQSSSTSRFSSLFSFPHLPKLYSYWFFVAEFLLYQTIPRLSQNIYFSKNCWIFKVSPSQITYFPLPSPSFHSRPTSQGLIFSPIICNKKIEFNVCIKILYLSTIFMIVFGGYFITQANNRKN